MLANGVTFFSPDIIALKIVADFVFRTLIESPTCPLSSATPIVDTFILELPIVTITVSFFSTSYESSKCRGLSIDPRERFLVTLRPITSSRLAKDPRALFFCIFVI